MIELINSIESILDTASGKIFKRGEDYYYEGMIDNLYRNDDMFEAEVCGSYDDRYNVYVKVDNNGEIEDYSCDCPYDYTDMCKHLVAVFLAIKNEDYETSKKTEAKSFGNNLETLENVTKNELIDFIIKYSNENAQFKTELLSEVLQKPSKQELSSIKETIRNSISRNKRKGYIDYRGCDNICEDLMKILTIAEKRLAKGYCRIAFDITLHVLLTGVKLASTADSSSGYLGAVIDSSYRILDNVCEYVEANIKDSKEHKYYYEKIISSSQKKIFDGWMGMDYDLLGKATYFVTNKNVRKLNNTVENLHQDKLEFGFEYSQTYKKQIQFKIILKLDGEKAADKFVLDNLDIDDFREIAIKKYIKEEQYEFAEQLCHEKIDSILQRNQIKWWDYLIDIYRTSNQDKKLIDILLKVVAFGEKSYYIMLKELLVSKRLWKKNYSKVLKKIENKTTSNFYMDILCIEEEWEKLLSKLQNNPYYIFTYGSKIAQHFPKQTYQIYKEVILNNAKTTSSRKQYRKLCDEIKELFVVRGYLEAIELIIEFEHKYNRRPAMLDELNQLRKRLKIEDKNAT